MHAYRPLGWTRNGKPIWPVRGGSGNGDGGDGGTPPGQSEPNSAVNATVTRGHVSVTGDSPPATPQGQATDKGFPDATPVTEMSAEQQAAYWRHHARKHEERVKALGDYDDLKAKAAKLDELEAANASETDKAVKAAREEAKSEALREVGGKMVDAHIKAAVTAGRLDEAQADIVLDGLDRTRFLTSDGGVDADKVKTFLDSIAPAKGNGFPDLGQGKRSSGTKVSGKEAGREEARRRFGERTAKTS